MIRPALVLLASLLCLSSAQAADKVYNAQTAELANGMQVVVIPVHRTPALTHMVWYRVGAGDEPWGVSGTAHFLEHLMFKGTLAVSAGKFSETVQRMGGNDNAFTAWDYTAYFQTVPKEKLADVMRMESERMNDLTPKLADVYSEKQVVMEERRQTTESDPGAILSERMRQALFPNHPYGRPIIGWMPEMQALTWVDSLAFYKKWYAPNNAILVISGDTTLAEVLPLAEATYGKLEREDVPMRARPVAPVLDGDVRITLSRPDVRQPEWTYMVRVPSERQNPDASLALSLLVDTLEGATGRLYKKLVVQDKIATGVDIGYDPHAWDDAVLGIYATPADGVSLEAMGTAVKSALAEIAAGGISADELEKSVARLTDESVFARDSLAGPAMTVGYSLASGATLEGIEIWPARLAAVTPGAVTDALSRYVLAPAGVTGWLLPEATAVPQKAASNAAGKPAKKAVKKTRKKGRKK